MFLIGAKLINLNEEFRKGAKHGLTSRGQENRVKEHYVSPTSWGIHRGSVAQRCACPGENFFLEGDWQLLQCETYYTGPGPFLCFSEPVLG